MWGYFFDVKDIQVIYFHFQLNCFSVSKIEKNGDKDDVRKMLVFSNRQPKYQI